MSGSELAPNAPLDGTLALFFSNAPVAVAMFDQDMRYLAWSTEWARAYRHEAEDLTGRSLYDVFPDIPDRWREAHRRGLRGEAVDCEEDLYHPKDGPQVWVRWRIRPIPAPEGGIMAIALFTEDITDRKLAALELQRAAERLQQITSSLSIGVFEHDFASGQTVISDGYLGLLGITREEVPQTTDGWTALLRPVDIEAYHEARRRALDPRGDGRFAIEVHPVVRGVERVMELQSRVQFRGEGAGRVPDRLVGIIVDQTESRRLQDALSRAQRLETIGRLAGLVAHDFNNILTVILANGIVALVWPET